MVGYVRLAGEVCERRNGTRDGHVGPACALQASTCTPVGR